MADVELIVKIPEDIYKASQILDVKYEDVIQIPLEVIANGIPRETVTEFADRCRECGREKVLDKIMDEVFDIDDEIVLNPDSVYERKAYVRLGNVMDIINKYKAESEK